MSAARDLADRFPSVMWDEKDWLVAFRYDNDLYHQILRGIGRTSARREPLTPMQARVVELYAQGLTLAQIGRRLYITENTVKTHTRWARERNGVTTTRQLIPLLPTPTEK